MFSVKEGIRYGNTVLKKLKKVVCPKILMSLVISKLVKEIN